MTFKLMCRTALQKIEKEKDFNDFIGHFSKIIDASIDKTCFVFEDNSFLVKTKDGCVYTGHHYDPILFKEIFDDEA